MDGLAIGSGIAQGLEKATNNFFNTMNAVKQLKTKEAMDEITIKQHKLEIDKLEKEIGNIDPDLVEQRRRQISLQEKSMKLNYLMAHENLSAVRQKTKKDVEVMHQKAKFFAGVMKDPELSKRVGYGASGLTFAPEKQGVMDWSSLMGGDAAGSATTTPSKSLNSVMGGESKYQVGQEFTHENGKRYRITGIEDPENPDIEEVV